MFSKFLTLDEFITPGLIKPLYLLGLALIVLFTLLGVLTGFAVLFSSPGAGLTAILTSLISAVISFIGLRISFEVYLAVFRLHDRFVGGHPKDRIPE
jgi:hypothetical protein